jgi:hypothetical protein
MQTAAAIAVNRPRSGARQVLVDIDTAGMEPAVLRTLLTQAPHGWRIEPVRHDGARHRYARRFTLDLIGRPDLRIEDAVAEAGPGDVWLTLGESKLGTVPAKWLARGVLACCLDPSDAAGEDGLAQRLAAVLADARPCAG